MALRLHQQRGAERRGQEEAAHAKLRALLAPGKAAGLARVGNAQAFGVVERLDRHVPELIVRRRSCLEPSNKRPEIACTLAPFGWPPPSRSVESTAQGKPVARRGRKARGLAGMRDSPAARTPDSFNFASPGGRLTCPISS